MNNDDPAKVFSLTLAIVGDYGAVLGNSENREGLGPLRSENELPHSKETIRESIAFLQLAIASPRGRADLIKALTPEEAQYALSEAFSKGLDFGLAFLDFYVSDSELSEQRKLNQDITKFMNEPKP